MASVLAGAALAACSIVTGGIALAFARASRGFDGEHAERLSTWSIVFFLISLGCAVALGMMVGG
jgi:succinate dehydrogenase/fumarate reductase cytochrome b subunit